MMSEFGRIACIGTSVLPSGTQVSSSPTCILPSTSVHVPFGMRSLVNMFSINTVFVGVPCAEITIHCIFMCVCVCVFTSIGITTSPPSTALQAVILCACMQFSVNISFPSIHTPTVSDVSDIDLYHLIIQTIWCVGCCVEIENFHFIFYVTVTV
jgi:hypothetical protein